MKIYYLITIAPWNFDITRDRSRQCVCVCMCDALYNYNYNSTLKVAMQEVRNERTYNLTQSNILPSRLARRNLPPRNIIRVRPRNPALLLEY